MRWLVAVFCILFTTLTALEHYRIFWNLDNVEDSSSQLYVSDYERASWNQGDEKRKSETGERDNDMYTAGLPIMILRLLALFEHTYFFISHIGKFKRRM